MNLGSVRISINKLNDFYDRFWATFYSVRARKHIPEHQIRSSSMYDKENSRYLVSLSMFNTYELCIFRRKERSQCICFCLKNADQFPYCSYMATQRRRQHRGMLMMMSIVHGIGRCRRHFGATHTHLITRKGGNTWTRTTMIAKAYKENRMSGWEFCAHQRNYYFLCFVSPWARLHWAHRG